MAKCPSVIYARQILEGSRRIPPIRSWHMAFKNTNLTPKGLDCVFLAV